MGRPDRADDSDPGPARRRRRRRARRGLLLAMGLLYAASIPWYRDGDAPLRLVAGLPDWVAIAIACYALIAVLNVLAWGLTEFQDELPPPGGAP